MSVITGAQCNLSTHMTKYLSRNVIITETAPTSTVIQTVPTTTTYLVQCTNSKLSNQIVCPGPFPIFKYEAPSIPQDTGIPTTTDSTAGDYFLAIRLQSSKEACEDISGKRVVVGPATQHLNT